MSEYNQPIAIGAQLAKKPEYKDLAEYAGFDFQTANTKAMLRALEMSGKMPKALQRYKDFLLTYLNQRGKAYFMTKGSSEITQLTVMLGDTRKTLKSVKTREP